MNDVHPAPNRIVDVVLAVGDTADQVVQRQSGGQQSDLGGVLPAGAPPQEDVDVGLDLPCSPGRRRPDIELFQLGVTAAHIPLSGMLVPDSSRLAQAGKPIKLSTSQSTKSSIAPTRMAPMARVSPLKVRVFETCRLRFRYQYV